MSILKFEFFDTDRESSVKSLYAADIYSISPDDTIRQALEVMALHNIGALLVLKEQKLVGILFARDYARSVQAKLKKLTNLKDQH